MGALDSSTLVADSGASGGHSVTLQWSEIRKNRVNYDVTIHCTEIGLSGGSGATELSSGHFILQ